MHLRHGYCMLIHFIHGYYCIYRPWQPLTYLYFPYCISLIDFSFTKIRMFLYARIYWLAEFGDVSCLRFNYLRVQTLTPTWEDFVGRFCRTFVNLNNIAPSIGTFAGCQCSDQRERNITTGLFGLDICRTILSDSSVGQF